MSGVRVPQGPPERPGKGAFRLLAGNPRSSRHSGGVATGATPRGERMSATMPLGHGPRGRFDVDQPGRPDSVSGGRSVSSGRGTGAKVLRVNHVGSDCTSSFGPASARSLARTAPRRLHRAAGAQGGVGPGQCVPRERQHPATRCSSLSAEMAIRVGPRRDSERTKWELKVVDGRGSFSRGSVHECPVPAALPVAAALSGEHALRAPPRRDRQADPVRHARPGC